MPLEEEDSSCRLEPYFCSRFNRRNKSSRTNHGEHAHAQLPGAGGTNAPPDQCLSVQLMTGRIHGKFLRLLFIIAHRRTVRWFKDVGDDHHSEDAFKFRRGQYFWHTRAAIGHGAAVAVAQRARVAGHTLRRPRAPPNARDALLFPATVPSGF